MALNIQAPSDVEPGSSSRQCTQSHHGKSWQDDTQEWTATRSGYPVDSGKADSAHPKQVCWPPTPSSTGKKFYALCKHHKHGPAVAVGKQKVDELLGDKWVLWGRCPEGFPTLEEAVSKVLKEHQRDKVISQIVILLSEESGPEGSE